MSQDFERKAKQQGDEFMLTPREGVWQRIEAELDQKKRRRIVGWWWSVPALLLLGFGFGYYFIHSTESVSKSGNSHNNSITTTKKETATANSQTETSTQPLPAEEIKTDNSVEPAQGQPGYASDVKSKSNKRESVSDNDLTVEQQATTYNAGKNNNTAKSGAATENTIHQQQEDANKETGSSTQPVLAGALITSGAAITSITSDNQATNSGLIEKVEPAPDSLPGENKISPTIVAVKLADSMPPEQTAAKSGVIEKSKKKKTNWYLLAGLGSANLSENNFPIGGAKSMAADFQTSNPSNPPVIPPVIVPDKARMSFDFSVQRRQDISKRWQWQAAIAWQYQQIEQYLGARVDSIIRTNTQNFSSTNSYYYQPGSSESVRSTNHRIYLANDFSWQVLKNKSWLRLYAGIYTGFNISNNYFVKDSDNRNIKNSDLYKTWFIGFTPGTEFIFKNKWTIGFNAHLDFTKAYMPLNGNNEYWRGWEIRAGIPLFKK